MVWPTTDRTPSISQLENVTTTSTERRCRRGACPQLALCLGEQPRFARDIAHAKHERCADTLSDFPLVGVLRWRHDVECEASPWPNAPLKTACSVDRCYRNLDHNVVLDACDVERMSVNIPRKSTGARSVHATNGLRANPTREPTTPFFLTQRYRARKIRWNQDLSCSSL